MTKQEIYDKVKAHMLKQKRKAFNPATSACAYRAPAPDGCRCAIGCLIEDEDYSPEMEGKIISVFRRAFPDVYKKLVPTDEISTVQDSKAFRQARFLMRLQRIHDTKDVTDWKNTLEAFAIGEELKP